MGQCPYKSHLKELVSLSALCCVRTQQAVVTQKQVFPQACQCPDLRLPASKTVRNQFLFISHPGYGLLS